MALYVPNEGELRLLDLMLRGETSSAFWLHLYKNGNNVTPGTNTTSSQFTEATFSGYSVMTLSRANWSVATTVSSKAESSYGGGVALSWTCGASGDTIYGYWVEDSATGKVLWAEKFTTQRSLEENDVLNLTPKFTLQTETE